jgi:hypothetical protein
MRGEVKIVFLQNGYFPDQKTLREEECDEEMDNDRVFGWVGFLDPLDGYCSQGPWGDR